MAQNKNYLEDFTFLIGTKFVVSASDEDEAWNKIGAYQSEDLCPCNENNCDCISEIESDTWQGNCDCVIEHAPNDEP